METQVCDWRLVNHAADVETDASSEPITTGRAPIGYDAVGEVVTMEDPGRGNVKNAAGNATSAGNPKMALP